MLQGQEGLETEDGMTLELCAGIIDKKDKSAEQHAVEGHDLINSSIIFLTLTRPIGLPPHAPVAQKIADQRFLYNTMWLKVG